MKIAFLTLGCKLNYAETSTYERGFKAAGLELTPDVWERLAADRRQALEDDLAWIHP